MEVRHGGAILPPFFSCLIIIWRCVLLGVIFLNYFWPLQTKFESMAKHGIQQNDNGTY